MQTGESFTLYEPGQTMSGLLSVSSQGCVTLEVNDEAALLVASNGSTLVDGGSSVLVEGHRTFELGSEVTLPGAVHRWERGTPHLNRPLSWGDCVADGDRTPFLAYVFPT